MRILWKIILHIKIFNKNKEKLEQKFANIYDIDILEY